MKKLWFKNKRYGLGWTPASWEGWVVILLYAVALGAVIGWGNASGAAQAHPVLFAAKCILLTGLLILLCVLKGESPQWNWKRKNFEK